MPAPRVETRVCVDCRLSESSGSEQKKPAVGRGLISREYLKRSTERFRTNCASGLNACDQPVINVDPLAVELGERKAIKLFAIGR